ncbi:MAG: methylmalonyl-CoA epimerase [Deltaproteobacteria bacterium]|jgi:methylmalonyl-CoA/ethylmalonyl-CoA epimerase|nr:methylmalonyl-CoA epimerase [Deltaproteobacteria bacterium]
MIRKIAHIGVAVKNLEEVEKLYSEVLGLPITGREVWPDNKVSFIPLGDTAIELLESVKPDGAIARHIEKRGEGIHHIALEVDNIEEALAELKAKGLALIDQKPRRGAHDAKIAFLHPKGTHGVLLELCEPKKH